MTHTAAIELGRLRQNGRLDLPVPGHGDTDLRHGALIDIAHESSVSVARLAEAHVDAVSILHEAGRVPHAGALYGVWASSSPDGGPILTGDLMNGTKRFCSGLGVVDRALMVVATPDGQSRLVDVDAQPDDTISVDTAQWATPALGDTATGQITYTDHDVDADALVGDGSWYLGRPGFWHGACGPAACWAGSTFGVIDVARSMVGDDPHQRAHVGAMEAAQWALSSLFAHAGREIDADPTDLSAAEHRARSIRQITERLCSDVLDRFSRAFGPRPFAADPDLAQRFMDTHLFLRQHHGERELGELVRSTGVSVQP